MTGYYKVNLVFPNGTKFRNGRTFTHIDEANAVKVQAEQAMQGTETKVEVQEVCRSCGSDAPIYDWGMCKSCCDCNPCYNCNNEYIDACSSCYVTASARGAD